MKHWLVLWILVGIVTGCAIPDQVRYPPIRWTSDLDRTPVKSPPSRPEYSYSDAVHYYLFYQGERLFNLSLRGEKILHYIGFPSLQEALNTNNFDEVPDSTWFTNRLGRHPMTVEELRRGPNLSNGPDPQGPWTIIAGKPEGVTPGFLIKDQRGDKYFVKFDPPGHMEMATAAEAIGTRVMYAMGYFVPEVYLVDFDPKILTISPDATRRDSHGHKVPFTNEALQEVFSKVESRANGLYRAAASKFIEGKVIGPFPLRGRWEEDKNDRIPHQHRRELRGYRVVSSLINNYDTREGNTLCSFIQTGPGNLGYVLHYIFDFSSALGSGAGLGKSSVVPKVKEHYDDYAFNLHKVSASMFSFGAYQPDWEKYEDSGIPSVGTLDSKYFHPGKWRPMYPNPDFQYMTDRDAFWATKILTRLSDADIRAIVEEGKYSDPAATDYVTKALIERRNRIGQFWFAQVNPLDNFKLVEQGNDIQLQFDDLMVVAGLKSPGSATYRYRVISRGNYEFQPWTETSEPSALLKSDAISQMRSGKLYLVQIQTRREGEKFFGPLVNVILKKDANLQIEGLDRHYRTKGADGPRTAEGLSAD